MKPQEFWNSTYREVKLFVECRSNQIKHEIKQHIVLAENLGNKLITGSAATKKPKNINLVKDIYSDLFEEELKNHDIFHPKPKEGKELLQFMYELGEELKNTSNNKN